MSSMSCAIGSITVPRGVLEPLPSGDYEETEPESWSMPERYVVVVCRSGNRRFLAAATLDFDGF